MRHRIPELVNQQRILVECLGQDVAYQIEKLSFETLVMLRMAMV